MLSMTGYGRGEYRESGIELSVEIKTVNNRYLDAAIKSPRIFAAYEEVMRGRIREKLTRGHADVYVTLSDKREKKKALVLGKGTPRSHTRRRQSAFRKFCPKFPSTSPRLPFCACPT